MADDAYYVIESDVCWLLRSKSVNSIVDDVRTRRRNHSPSTVSAVTVVN